MKNKKGFTLVELLAVIAILGLVVAIAIPSIVGMIGNSNDKVNSAQIEEFESLAKIWGNDYKGSMVDNKCYYMTLPDMVNIDLLAEIPNDSDGKAYPELSGIQITKKDNKLSYEYKENVKSDCSSFSNVLPNTLTYNNLTVPSPDKDDTPTEGGASPEAGKEIPHFTDKSGANPPKLAEGMIPVVYDEETDNWLVADQSKGWYAYQDQIWANAVTVSDASLRSAAPGTVLPMDKINSMWVWIPRYKYKIPSDYIGSTSNVSDPPQIEVAFESGTTTTGSALSTCPIDADAKEDCYYTHPAFRDGNSAELLTSTQISNGSHTGWDTELTGIWVGKFKMGGSNDTPLIKPDINILIDNSISRQFITTLKFVGGTMDSNTGEVTFSGNDTYGLTGTTDTHMIKNTEWGAVAYLSQSKYGKNGNNNYVGTDKEIYKNDANPTLAGGSYITGRSRGMIDSNTTSFGSYSYNGKTCNTEVLECTGSKNILKGTGASTTGTIYGIYDMVGGTLSYVMGNYEGETDRYFSISPPNKKYWDKYTGTSGSDITKGKAIKGDATYETMNWYSDSILLIDSESPWFLRGLSLNNAGIFGTQCDGRSYEKYGYIAVLVP